jgi:tetratricopeptide (TPR) repeat protein
MEEILALVLEAKNELRDELGMSEPDHPDRHKAANVMLNAALKAYKSENYEEALRLFRKLQKTLEKYNLWRSMWGELCITRASCCYEIGNARGAQAACNQARDYEPDNQKLRKYAGDWGLKWSEGN